MYTVLLIGVLSSLAVVHCNQLQDQICIVPPDGNVNITILGKQGPEGNPGVVGPKGKEGRVGKPGEKGKRGESGPVGPQGNPGLPGAIGPRGHRGVDGARGHPGREGPHGPPGPPGLAGVRGLTGPEGSTGTCNFSDPAYQKLTEDIRINLKEEIREELERDYVLTPSHPHLCSKFNGQSKEKPASSCKHIYQCSTSTASSGYYWINSSNSTSASISQMYCAMNLPHCGNTTGGWTRVAYINMNNSAQTCPVGLSSIGYPKRMCGRSYNWRGCRSVTLPAYGGSYTNVCGRALGYQFKSGTHAFYGENTINHYYVDGLSITYGNPRHHVWTFASGTSKDENIDGRCPCAPIAYNKYNNRYFRARGVTSVPSFVGNDFFCESGKSKYSTENENWYLDDPLWDSKGCAYGSTCCNGPNRPWFYRDLNTTVSENMEVRMCFNDEYNQANIGVEELEIYVS